MREREYWNFNYTAFFQPFAIVVILLNTHVRSAHLIISSITSTKGFLLAYILNPKLNLFIYSIHSILKLSWLHHYYLAELIFTNISISPPIYFTTL